MLREYICGALFLGATACNPAFIPPGENIPDEEVAVGTGLHYIISNENRLDLFYPYLHARRGVMLGVGTDQNLVLMGWAESNGAILVDRDAFAVLTNRLHVQALQQSRDFAGFRNFWSDAVRVSAAARATSPGISDADLAHYMELVTNARGVTHRLRRLQAMAKRTGVENFTTSTKHFDHLKRMAAAGAIRVVRADLAGSTTMRALSQQLNQRRIPLSLVYLSNIEDYRIDEAALRRNLGLFALTDGALILRTLNRLDGVTYPFPENEEFAQTQPFHYNMQGVADFIRCGLPKRGKHAERLEHIARGISRVQCGASAPH